MLGYLAACFHFLFLRSEVTCKYICCLRLLVKTHFLILGWLSCKTWVLQQMSVSSVCSWNWLKRAITIKAIISINSDRKIFFYTRTIYSVDFKISDVFVGWTDTFASDYRSSAWHYLSLFGFVLLTYNMMGITSTAGAKELVTGSETATIGTNEVDAASPSGLEIPQVQQVQSIPTTLPAELTTRVSCAK